jgi:predicted transcriptional regulator
LENGDSRVDSETARLAALQVEDVMTHRVVTVSVNNTMSEAADLFSEHQITGAPVIDELGHCVGVLSATDFVHSKAEELDGRHEVGHFLCSRHPSGLYGIDEVRHDLVRSHMSPAVQTMDQSASLLMAARCMCQEHVHRLIVIDIRGAPTGILTSLDLIAAMISAVED